MQSESAVSGQLGKDDVLVADPPLVEAHRQAHHLQAEVGHEGNAGNVEELLLSVGIQGEQRVGVLRQVVGAVEFPEAVKLVHDAVVPVEPEVQHDTVQTDLEGKPGPADCRGSHARPVAEEDGEDWAEGRGGQERSEDLGNSHIGHSISFMLVTVQESKRVP